MLHHPSHPTDYTIDYEITTTGGVKVQSRRLYDIVDFACQNPYTAISDRDTGLYAVYSASGFDSETDMPTAEFITILPMNNSLVEIIPTACDKEKIHKQFHSSIEALEFIFESYPSIETLPSQVYQETEL